MHKHKKKVGWRNGVDVVVWHPSRLVQGFETYIFTRLL